MPIAISRDRIHVAVDVLMLTVRAGRLHLLLCRRSHAPYEGCWALPGRLVGLHESTESAARALLRETTSLQDAYLEQLFTFSAVGRDPRGRVISAAYLVILSPQQLAAALDGKEDALRCFAVACGADGLQLSGGDTALTGSDLAFDHGQIISTGVSRLRGKIDYTDIGLHFLSDMQSFALSELKDVFEAVLGKPVDASNFRRTIRARYETTGRMIQTRQAEKRGRGRPAALYRIDKL